MTQTTSATRVENLALIFQEVFTAIERLRSNRQSVSDAESFRQQIREAVKSAAQEARNRGAYSTADIKIATLAVVGFLDETILTLQNPVFANWPGKPLQHELFNTDMAGEVFFQDLQALLGRSDSEDLADILEVHYLCLLLGFSGRYSHANRGDLQGFMRETAERIRRIRGEFTGLAPAWQPPVERVNPPRDPWAKRLLIAALSFFALAVLLFVLYKLVLDSGASSLRTIVS
jgi:type VI secretion system protein ImpK